MHARLLAIATAVATTVSGVVIAAAPADAASTLTRGRVTAHGGLAAHEVPTTLSARTGAYAQGRVLSLDCAVHGPDVDGNALWYRVHTSASQWVSARYVVGAAPRACGDGLTRHGQVTAERLFRRVGPSLSATIAGVSARGARANVVCHLPGETGSDVVDWYELTNGSWVSARYISPLDGRPALCA